MIRLSQHLRLIISIVSAMAAILISRRAAALDPQKSITQFSHRAWGEADGIAEAKCVAQTEDGYLWVAASNGLFQYDGAVFKPWRSPLGEPPLPNKLGALLGARDGSLWILSARAVSHLEHGHLTVFESEAFITSQTMILFEGPYASCQTPATEC